MNSYNTSDIKFSALLCSLGFNYSYDSNNGKLVFIFPDLPFEKAQDIRIKYNNKDETLKIHPLEYNQSMDALLDVVHDERRRRSGR